VRSDFATTWKVLAGLVLLAAAAWASPQVDRTAGAQDEQDLLAVQGKWEREELTPAAPYRRAVKEVKGNEEVVAYYRSDGTLWRAHRAQFKLSRTGDVKVFTFSNVQITDGEGKGTRFEGPSSYIYLATDRQFKEVSGLLPGQEAQPLSVLTWVRAREDPGQVIVLPKPDGRLQGNWEPVHSEEGGVDAKDMRDYLVRFEGDCFTVLREGKLMLRGTFIVFSAREPRRIDIRIVEDVDNPDNAGKTLQGIYAIEGEELRWCTGTTAASAPPTEFVTREGEPFMLVIMNRMRPEKKAG
jgi:uncharacterized protein (TIGR03067 family)